MKYRWIGKNVNLNSLVETIQDFLKKRKFRLHLEESGNLYKLIGTFRNEKNEIRNAVVTISGAPDDFIVELDTEQVETMLKFSSLISFFGIGGLLFKKHQSMGFYRRFEEDFWDYVEGRVAQLVGSAKLPS